jgi:hypothetical protein
MKNKLFSGNFEEPWHLDRDKGEDVFPYPCQKRLVEECMEFTLLDLRRIYKRKELLLLAENGYPAEFQLEGKKFFLYLTVEYLSRSMHFQVVTEIRRVWMLCPICFRRIRKVYTYPHENGLADIKCRLCHGLKHQSSNCTGNRWWRNYALPLKRLLNRRKKLLLKDTPRVMAQLQEADQFIWMLRERAVYKRNIRMTVSKRTNRKRPYRDLSIVR